MTDWQPIETAPKDGTRILVSDGKEVNTTQYEGRWIASPPMLDGYGDNSGLYDLAFKPKYWMPMTELPVND